MTVTIDIDRLYEQQIKNLPRTARLQLLARIANDLDESDAEDGPLLNLLDLEGVGAELWQGIDAQAYVHAERDSWD